MKGIIFTILNDMVEEHMGLEVWNTVISESDLPSRGIYTAVETYPDEELFSIVQKLHEKSGMPMDKLIMAFGEYCVPVFAKNYGQFFEGHSAKTFLMSVEGVIHVEVKKLYSKTRLPVFDYEDIGNNELVMIYRSPRKLFDLVEGMIHGTAKHFGETIEVKRIMDERIDEFACRYHLKFL